MGPRWRRPVSAPGRAALRRVIDLTCDDAAIPLRDYKIRKDSPTGNSGMPPSNVYVLIGLLRPYALPDNPWLLGETCVPAWALVLVVRLWFDHTDSDGVDEYVVEEALKYCAGQPDAAEAARALVTIHILAHATLSGCSTSTPDVSAFLSRTRRAALGGKG